MSMIHTMNIYYRMMRSFQMYEDKLIYALNRAKSFPFYLYDIDGRIVFEQTDWGKWAKYQYSNGELTYSEKSNGYIFEVVGDTHSVRYKKDDEK